MNFYERLKNNISDVVNFGPSFLWRHSPRITGSETAVVPIRGFGHLHLRTGESDVGVVRQIFARHSYEVGRRLSKRIDLRYCNIIQSKKTPVIVDAGANIGAASLWFARKYPLAAIVAVEPEKGNFRVLEKNSRYEPKIGALNAAVGSTSGYVSVENTGLGLAARTFRAEGGVPIIKMKDAFARVENGTPFIAKIDIEGFESDLFSQNTEWLADVYAVFIEPHDWLFPGKMTSRTFQCAMGKHNFEIYIKGDNLIYVRC